LSAADDPLRRSGDGDVLRRRHQGPRELRWLRHHLRRDSDLRTGEVRLTATVSAS
jgi:hypothetical protein